MIEDYIDGLLSEKDRKELEAHVAECDECRASLRFALALIEMTHASAEEMPRELHDKIITKTQTNGKRKQLLRRAALFAACAVIFVSSVAAWALLPGRQKAEDIPPDNIASKDSLSEETVSLQNDVTSVGKLEIFAPEAVETDALPETEEVAEAPEIDTDEKVNIEYEMPEDMTQAEAVIPSPEEVATDAPPIADTSAAGSQDTAHLAPESMSKTSPGGEDITLALLIVSGLLAIASFIAFLISLSSVRQISSKKDKE